MESTLLDAAATHGPSFVFALLLLYEVRDMRSMFREERQNWRKTVDNNTEALRELKDSRPFRADGGDRGDE